MYEIFEHLLQKFGVTPYKVSKQTGVTQTTLSNWKKGKKYSEQQQFTKNRRLFRSFRRLPYDWRRKGG